MLLSHKYNFLFIHIAKTGGTSIRSALTRRVWADPYRLPQVLCSRLSGWTGHRLGIKFPRHAKAIAALEMLPTDFFHSLFKFAFVRNPWDLQVSSYHHIKRERPHVLGKISDFASFLHWKLEGKRAYHYIVDASVEPQWHSLIDLQGNCIVDYIGRFETLPQDFHAICQKIGWPNVPLLPQKRMATKRSDYRAYYNDQTAELVQNHFQPDIEAFDYTFDPS
jgi:hypothetical protein